MRSSVFRLRSWSGVLTSGESFGLVMVLRLIHEQE
jgi:hypothetical protein